MLSVERRLGDDNNLAFIAMEYIDGRTLAELVFRNKARRTRKRRSKLSQKGWISDCQCLKSFGFSCLGKEASVQNVEGAGNISILRNRNQTSLQRSCAATFPRPLWRRQRYDSDSESADPRRGFAGSSIETRDRMGGPASGRAADRMATGEFGPNAAKY